MNSLVQVLALKAHGPDSENQIVTPLASSGARGRTSASFFNSIGLVKLLEIKMGLDGSRIRNLGNKIVDVGVAFADAITPNRDIGGNKDRISTPNSSSPAPNSASPAPNSSSPAPNSSSPAPNTPNVLLDSFSNGVQAVTNIASLGSTAATAMVDTNAGIEAGHFMAQLMQRLSLAAALDNITKKLGEQMKSPTQ